LKANEFQVNVGGAVHIVELLNEETVQVDGRSYSFDMVQAAQQSYSMLLNETAFEIYMLGFTRESEDKCLQLGIEGNYYDVVVEDQRSLLRKRMLLTRPHSTGVQEVRAPMPGKVVRIEVKTGDTVKSGVGLLVLEAMKMENEIKSSLAAIVEAVHVIPGKAVEKGELLFTLTLKP
jgi:biotin carboxyl carrier protein